MKTLPDWPAHQPVFVALQRARDEHPGEIVEVKRWDWRGRAGYWVRAIERGEVEVPGGKDEWEFRSDLIGKGENAKSRLLAKYIGSDNG
jgi:hypothetical protein